MRTITGTYVSEKKETDEKSSLARLTRRASSAELHKAAGPVRCHMRNRQIDTSCRPAHLLHTTSAILAIIREGTPLRLESEKPIP